MNIGEILNAVYDKNVGWRPASGAIKPVHIANGLFRELLGGQYHSITDVLNFLVPYKSKDTQEADPKRTYQHLVQDTQDPRYAAFRDERHKERFERLRDFSRGLVGTDKAVFPQERMTSLTLTCQQMVSTDISDREVGRFMSHILLGKEKDGLLGKHIVELLKEDPHDPITFLMMPLLSRDPKYSVKNTGRCSPYENEELKLFFEHLEQAAGCLFAHEKEQGNRLATLQRVVHFACLSLLAHAQALAKNGDLKSRTPLLLVMDAPKGSSLAIASEQSLVAFLESFEEWLAQQLARRIANNEPLSLRSDEGEKSQMLRGLPDRNRQSVREFFSTEVASVKGEPAVRDLVDSRMGFFEQSLNRHLTGAGADMAMLTEETWVRVIAEALVQCYLHEYESGGPRKFLQGVGRKAGIIYPHYQGRSKEKRIRPSVAILDLLVRSCCPVDTPLPLPVFLNILWERFGIVVGGRGNGSGDHELLSKAGIDVSQNDLEENTISFVDHLVQIGLARRYPDNISYVGKHNA